MPFLGHENFREIEIAALSGAKSNSSVPYRRVFRINETSTATSANPKDAGGSQVIYLPTPVSGTARGAINWTMYADVNGTHGTATEVGNYSVTTGGAVTYTGGILGAAINGASFTPTANNTVTAIEIIITGLTIANTLSVYIVAEVFPYTPIDDVINIKPTTSPSAVLTVAEPGTIV